MRDRLLDTLPHSLSWAVPDYGFLVALACLLGCVSVSRRLRRAGWSDPRGLTALVWAVFGAFLGAKILYLLERNPGGVWRIESFPQFLAGGFSLYGGAIGASLAAFIYLYWRRIPDYGYADAAAPAMGLAIAVSRAGCFMRGCDFGSPTDLPWGVRFPSGTHPFQTHLGSGLIETHDDLSLPTHPLQLYESGLGVALYFAALYLLPRRAFKGQVYLTTAMLYCVFRFVLEYLRDPEAVTQVGGFTFMQLVAAGCVLVGAVLYIYLRGKVSVRS